MYIQVKNRANAEKFLLHQNLFHNTKSYIWMKKKKLPVLIVTEYSVINMTLKYTCVYILVKSRACVTCAKRYFARHSLLTDTKEKCTGMSGRFECKVCGSTFKRKVMILQDNCTIYMRGIAKLKGLPLCSFINEFYRINRTLVCDACGKGFDQNANLQAHIKTYIAEEPLQCNVCEQTFTLNCHMHTHDIKKPFKCDICSTPFRRRHYMQTHVKLHAQKKPFQCTICQQTFRLKCHMSAHDSQHRMFFCDDCATFFATNGNLKRHMQRYREETPFQCDICKKTFSSACHMHTHGVKSPFTCNSCGGSFSKRDNLLYHIDTYHACSKTNSVSPYSVGKHRKKETQNLTCKTCGSSAPKSFQRTLRLYDCEFRHVSNLHKHVNNHAILTSDTVC